MIVMVNACTRDGVGGSPTAIVDEDPELDDNGRCEIVRASGASHGAFLNLPDVRFFTRSGELRNCGHGTIALHGLLLHRSEADEQQVEQRTGGRTFTATAARRPGGAEVWFDQGEVTVSEPAGDLTGMTAALGVADPGRIRVASPGTPRLMVPVADRATLMSLTPDFARLAGECRQAGMLGCFVYALESDGVAVARMFAPAIGVDEDVLNANSSGCLAAILDGRVEVRQGDALGRPSSVLAVADGRTVRVGGMVTVPLSKPGAGIRGSGKPCVRSGGPAAGTK
ncbi:PhzF family phenazine biosynthesis protein [Actinoplanes siamensis]|uniref:PhzF family phenazine biosynthesis protein n=1 Tax=Actinoplanes siamensis TaxID=1223317 RepID=A0A919NC96_9ACTN|nr:PhzF family phenazine biosynthesis protein [Actinoplanes siamensis]GIF08471.1 hypothetical protein Asi03nite_60090 [Actinoplanes siamensis]